MEFGPIQKRFFGATEGGFSKVTATEFGDSQLTLTDGEHVVVEDYFGSRNILRGPSKSNPEKALKSFKVYPEGNEIQLNVNYPKSAGTELRLYFSGGFKPQTGDIFFVYKKANNLWVGSLPQSEWDRMGVTDDEDEQYVAMVSGESKPVKIVQRSGGTTYARDPNLGIQRIQLADYKCEVDASHPLFPSRATGRPFLEAHHLIQMAFQSEFQESLDVIENIFSLCPTCHRAIHHADQNVTRLLVERLLDVRPTLLAKFKTDRRFLLRLYNC